MRGFGQAPVFIDPPVYNDGGLKRVTAAAKPAAMWSLNATTVLDPSLGFTQRPYSNFKDSFELSVPSGPGTNWLDAKVKEGYVVMLVPPDPTNLGPNLTFIITKDPVAVKTASAYINPVGAVILDGPRSVIEAAKGQAPSVPGIPGSGGTCPPGKVGIPPFCLPVPSGGGGGGQQPTPPFVPPLPGGGGQSPAPTPTPSPTDPSQTPTPVVPPPAPTPTPAPAPAPQKPATAAMGGSGWVLPVLVGIGAISLISLSAASRKKRR